MNIIQKSKYILSPLILILSLGFPTLNALAQNNTLFSRPQITVSGKPYSPPPIQLPDLVKLNWSTPNDVFQFIVTILTIITGLLAFAYMLYGGFKYITSAGDPAAAAQGKNMVIGSIIGIVIVALSSVVVRFILTLIRQSLGG